MPDPQVGAVDLETDAKGEQIALGALRKARRTDDLESLEETLEITRDPSLMASIARSRAQSKAGKRTPLADILAE